MKYFFFIFILFPVLELKSQAFLKLGSNPFTIQNTSIFELEAIDRGFLLPRLTSSQSALMVNKAKINSASGLLIYNLDCKCLQVFDATSASGHWQSLTSGSSVWSLQGNSLNHSSPNFLGTLDNHDLILKTNNIERLRLTSEGEINFSNHKILNFSTSIKSISDTLYSLNSVDNGSILVFSSSNDIVLTIPVDLPVGFNVVCFQFGVGNIQFLPNPNVLLFNKSNSFSSSGQYSSISLLSIALNQFILSGDVN